MKRLYHYGEIRTLISSLNKKAEINRDNIKNIDDILIEIATKESCHGEGTLYASVMPGINFDIAFNYAKKWQEKGLIPYGPFIINGTNCSRFVSSVSKKISISFIQKMRFKFPITICFSGNFSFTFFA